MPDYEELYYTMMRAAEEALRIIIDAQQKCEEIYLSQSDNEQQQKSAD